MLEKIKEKFKRKEDKKLTIKKSNVNTNIIIYFAITLLSSIFIYYLSKNILLVIIFMITIFIALISFNNVFKNDDTSVDELNNRINFYKLFVLYSSLETSYKEGYKKAISNLEICKLKDELENLDDSEINKQLLPLTRNREEIVLLENLFYGVNNDDLTDIASIKVSETLLNNFLNKLKLNKTSSFSYYVVLPFILLIIDIILFLMNCK